MKATSTISGKPSSTKSSAVTSSSSRERRIVGGGQLHRTSSSHPSSAYKYYSKKSRRDLSSTSSSNSHHHQHAWLRNPFVVFTLSFLALGSLRLRVRHSPSSPTEGNLSVGQRLRNLRPHRGNNNHNNNNPVKKTVAVAASETHTLLQKKFHQGNKDEKKKDPFTAMTISKTPPSAVKYSLVEEGKLHGADGGPSFQRFVAKDQSSGKPLSVSQWADFASKNDNDAGFIDVLKNSPYAAYFFETKGVTTANAGQKSFEFVLVEAPDLHRFASQTARRAASASAASVAADEGQWTVQLLTQQVPFQDQFSSKQCSASDMGCVFPNLGGDATLIAPKPIFTAPQEKNSNAAMAKKSHDENQFGVYSHLAAFCRGASKSQVESVLKQAVGAYAERLSKASNEKAAPVWFSTSGMGVAWLHFRLDSRPKYYTYKPFAKEQ